MLADQHFAAWPSKSIQARLEILRKSLPSLRNELAHGSSMLTSQVLGTIELVAEILSQIFAPDLGAMASDTIQRGRSR